MASTTSAICLATRCKSITGLMHDCLMLRMLPFLSCAECAPSQVMRIDLYGDGMVTLVVLLQVSLSVVKKNPICRLNM